MVYNRTAIDMIGFKINPYHIRGYISYNYSILSGVKIALIPVQSYSGKLVVLCEMIIIGNK